jgi:hypothetical protein
MRSTVLLVVLGLALAGCSDGGDDVTSGSTEATESAGPTDPAGADPAEVSEASTASPQTAADVASTVVDVGSAPTTRPEAVIDIENQPGEGTFEGALDDAVFECERTDTGWRATGAVTNSTAAIVGYRIFVSFLDPAGETVALLEVADDLAVVAAGEERAWEVGFDSGADDLTCVARVERRQA